MKLAKLFLAFFLLYGPAAHGAEKDLLGDLRQQAETGIAQAQYELGVTLSSLKDKQKEAVQWIEKAATQGYAEAEQLLGEFYLNGVAGYEKNMEEARQWFEKASRQGLKKAYASMGSYYWEQAEKADEQRLDACAWFALANDIRNVEECDRVLTPEQKEAVYERFETLKRAYPN